MRPLLQMGEVDAEPRDTDLGAVHTDLGCVITKMGIEESCRKGIVGGSVEVVVKELLPPVAVGTAALHGLVGASSLLGPAAGTYCGWGFRVGRRQ